MGKVQKTVVRHGLLVKLESAYDEGYSTTSPAEADDGVEPEDAIEIPTEYEFSGERETSAGAGTGTLQRSSASGRFGNVDIPVLMRGAGSAYAAADDVEVNALLQAAGHTATVDTTAGAEFVEYSPSTDLADLASIAAGFYGRGQLYKAQAGLATVQAELTDAGHLLWTFGSNLLFRDDISDVARPSITLPSLIHPTATNVGLTLGNYQAVLRSFSFSMNRDISGRGDYAGGGHAGFAPGVIEPVVEVTIEAASLASSSPWHTASDFDPHKFYEDGLTMALAATFGGTQYNRVVFNAPQAQLASPPDPDADGNTATWNLEFMLPPSNAAADDHYTWKFD